MSFKKGIWSPEEDAKMMAYVSKHGTGNWTAVPKKAGLKRCGKSCRLRWNNYLRPDLKHDNFTPHEEELIIKLHGAIGTRWSIIAQQLPGRTDNDVKNYWNSKLRKKLKDMGIDPVTHKPYSQILEDYENIGGLRKFDHGRIGSLNKDLKHAFNQIEGSSDDQIVNFSNVISKSTQMREEIQVLSGSHCPNQYESSHLLDQLQAIKKFTETPDNGKSIGTSHWGYSMMFSPATSSSSSSACSNGNNPNPSFSGMNWKDYLLDDVFVPTDATQNDITECFDGGVMDDNQIMEGSDLVKNVADCVGGMKCTSDVSFLDEMLAGENEMMLLEFPSLLDDSAF